MPCSCDRRGMWDRRVNIGQTLNENLGLSTLEPLIKLIIKHYTGKCNHSIGNEMVRPTGKGVGLRVADSHTGNHLEDGFTSLETIRRLLVVIGRRFHSGFEGEAFEPDRRHLGRYLTSVRVFDDPIMFLAGLKPSWEFGQQRPAIIVGDNEMAFRNFIYTEDDDDLSFKEPVPGFGIGSPSASVNTKLPKDVEEPEVQPAEITADSGESLKAGVFIVHPGSVAAHIKERKCKTREGSLRPPVKRKLASGSSSSRAVHAKTSASKNDSLILSISNDYEGLPDCFKLKDANAYHLKIAAITPPAWKGHLDNQMNLELLDLHDRCYARQAIVDNAVNKRAREFLQVIEKMSGEANVIKARERSYEEECNLDRMMIESQKWLGYQVTFLTRESKVDSLEAKKAKLEAVEASLLREVEELKQDRRDVVSKVVPYAAMKLVHSDELGRLVGTLVSFAITYGRCRAYEQVATMKEPFDLSKAKGYHSSYKKEHTKASNDFFHYNVPLAGRVRSRCRNFD
ncbi:hypothetical protein Tco_0740750 [Tanacetum coccineum]